MDNLFSPRKRSRPSPVATPWTGENRVHDPSQRILVVGEGDFSLTQSLVRDDSNLSNLTATTLRSYRETYSDFPKAIKRMSELKMRGATILHDVDGRKLIQRHGIRNNYNMIYFTFPFVDGLPSSHPEQARLVKQFLRSASNVLSNGGEVCVVLHVSRKGVGQFERWKVAEAAKSAGLELAGKHMFDSKLFPTYVPSRGDGKQFNIQGGCCYYFRRPLKTVLSVFRHELQTSLQTNPKAHFAKAIMQQVSELDMFEQHRSDRQLALSTARFADVDDA